MATTTDQVVETFEDIEANVAIACNWPLFSKTDLHVYYGYERVEATQDVDFTVALSAPNYANFTVTPKTVLLTKINALIAANPAETNYIEVRRVMGVTTTMTSAAARDTNQVSREFERTSMRLAEHKERLDRVFALPIQTDEEDYDLRLPTYEAGRVLMWDAVLKKLVNSSLSLLDDPTEQAVAAALAAAADRVLAQAAAVATDEDRAVVEAAVAAMRFVPDTGTVTHILTKTGPGALDYAFEPAPVQVVFTTGMVMGFDDDTPPAGWIKRNGGTIGNAASGATTRANADTVNLFAKYWARDPLDCPIQDSTGAASVRGADAATDFAANKRIVMPDARGEFMRGWDDGRGVDVGRRLGSAQAEMIGPHGHALAMDAVANHAHVLSLGAFFGANQSGNRGFCKGDSGGDGFSPGTSGAGAHTPTGTATNNTGTENRPRNSAVLICVKL